MSSTDIPTSLLFLPADCRLAIILAAASHSAADRMTLRCFLLLCKDFYKLVLANWSLIVEHYTIREVLSSEVRYIFCGQRHRDNDLPAIIRADGTQYWCQHDELHRDNNLPAITRTDGTQEWYYHNKLHRDNGLPAVICSDGTQEWYQYGKLIRKQ